MAETGERGVEAPLTCPLMGLGEPRARREGEPKSVGGVAGRRTEGEVVLVARQEGTRGREKRGWGGGELEFVGKCPEEGGELNHPSFSLLRRRRSTERWKREGKDSRSTME